MSADRGLLPISVIVLTYNEATNLGACLDSVEAWVGEIFVVDSGSTDSTVEIACRYTQHVVSHAFENYAQQRNWAQDSLPLSYDWVLHIDADERVSPELAASIRHFFESEQTGSTTGAMFSRRTVFMGRWIRHGGHYPVYHTRLFRRDCGRCEDRLYDQHFVVAGRVVRLPGDLIDVLTSDLDTWSRRHLRWAMAEAREQMLEATNARSMLEPSLHSVIGRRRWLRDRVFGRSPLFARAFLYFGYRYILRRGFLDGTEGLIFHFLHACWFRFYVDAQIWEARSRAPDTRLRASEGSDEQVGPSARVSSDWASR